tara:strand:- start:1640 stop:2125 length:486 start_codon:yes stop_codon:yes gene_type:complete
MVKSKKNKRRSQRRRRSHKNKAGVLTFTHLKELKKLKAKANDLPRWNYDSPSDIPDFLRNAEIQNNPDNWAKDNLWRCLNKCRKKPGTPGCEAKCIQKEIDKTERHKYSAKHYHKAKKTMKKYIPKFKEKVEKIKAFNSTRRATRLKNTNPRILHTIKGYL